MDIDANKVLEFINKEIETEYENYIYHLKMVGETYIKSLQIVDSSTSKNDETLSRLSNETLLREAKVTAMRNLEQGIRNNLYNFVEID